MAAPMPAPVKPDSDSGVSRIRSELRLQPLAHRVATTVAANVLAHEEDTLIADERNADRRAHSFPVAKLQRFRLARVVRHDAHCPPVRLPFPHR
jgi:hypothetical protein